MKFSRSYLSLAIFLTALSLVAVSGASASTTGSPTLVGRLEDQSQFSVAYQLVVDGDYAYAINNSGDSSKPSVVDMHVADPTNPASRIAAIDITDPTNPRLISTTAALPDGSAPGSISLIDVTDGHAFYSANSTLGVVNVSNPQSMTFVGSATSTDISADYGLAVSGSYAYLLNENNTPGEANFVVADISAFVAPPIASPSPPPGPSGGGGMIVGSGPTAPSAVGLSGYTPPRPQIDYPNGTVVYLGATTTVSTPTPTATVSSTPITPQAVPASSSPFLIDRQLWDEGPDILALQRFLNTHGFPLVSTGWGSPGNETDTFGPHTYAALVKFQQVNNLPATGFLGPLTRAALASTSATTAAATTTNATSTAR